MSELEIVQTLKAILKDATVIRRRNHRADLAALRSLRELDEGVELLVER
jgi:hypothetical protein